MPEIYTIGENEIEIESEDLSLQAEWCNKNSENLQDLWVSAVTAELDQVAAVDPRPVGQARIEQDSLFYSNINKKWSKSESGLKPSISPVKPEVPVRLTAVEALNWPDAHLGVDFRPHLFDNDSKKFVLVDSGSQVCAFPPEPGDRVVPGIVLKAANGSKIKCYGRQERVIRINRKEYRFMAYKADVASPILGWDFVKYHRLALTWNENGEQCIYDKKAKITKVLEFKSVAHHESSGLRNLAVVETFKCRRSPEESQELAFQVAAVQNLAAEAEESEDLSVMPDSDYKRLLEKYPEILKQNFSEEFTKSGITHRINIKEGATPCKAKLRRILPGSPKAAKAKEAWDEYVRLGIVEKVDPSQANTWSSPLHFVWKSDNTLRVTTEESTNGLSLTSIPSLTSETMFMTLQGVKFLVKWTSVRRFITC